MGIVHRDLKPANILVSDLGVVRLLDYGVASVDDLDTLTLDGEVVGTPRYLAPEQVSGEEVGPATDVYALGLVLIECLVGAHPFEGTAIESMGARLHRDPVIPPSLGEQGSALLSVMTARDPGDRPPASEVSERLAELGVGADLRPLGTSTGAAVDLEGTTVSWDASAATPMVASTDPTLYLDPGVTTTEAVPPASVVAVPAGRAGPDTPHPTSRGRRRWWLAFFLVAALVVVGSVAGAWVLADRADDPTVPTTSTEGPTTTTTVRPTSTTVRPTTTTAPPTTTTTAKGHGPKSGKGGKPGG